MDPVAVGGRLGSSSGEWLRLEEEHAARHVRMTSRRRRTGGAKVRWVARIWHGGRATAWIRRWAAAVGQHDAAPALERPHVDGGGAPGWAWWACGGLGVPNQGF
nr:unnamed protein product [Digitaria exilis]